MSRLSKTEWIAAQLEALPPPDTIVHLGAGLCPELATYERVSPSRLYLFEADPERFVELRQRTAECGYITCVPMAIGKETGTARLFRFTDSQRNSLAPPDNLDRVLPGLVSTDNIEVPTLGVADLVDRLPIDPEQHNWLVIDVPDLAEQIIRGLEETGALLAFGSIVVSGVGKSLGEDPQAAEQTLKRLMEAGYRQQGTQDNSDPLWPRFHFKLSRDALECRESLRKINELQSELDHVAEERNRIETTLRDRKLELDRALAEKQEAAQRAKTTIENLEQRAAGLQGELDQRNAELERARQEQEQSARELKTTIENLEQRRSELESRLEQRSTELTDLRKADASRAEELKTQIQGLQSDLSVSLKLQRLREADLKDLQQRYSEILELKERQEALLRRLRQRLGAASDYLKRINLQGGETIGQELADNLVRALTGESDAD